MFQHLYYVLNQNYYLCNSNNNVLTRHLFILFERNNETYINKVKNLWIDLVEYSEVNNV